MGVSFERTWPAGAVEAMKERGYQVSTAASATVSAVGLGEKAGEFVAAMR
jgi:hypothetical protein